MSHVVRKHLRLESDAYDAAIRTFIPGYEEALTRAASEIAGVRPTLVLDFGTGTGALAEALLAHDRVGPLKPSTLIQRCWPRRASGSRDLDPAAGPPRVVRGAAPSA